MADQPFQPEAASQSDKLDEELVAYLDGELDAPSVAHIEQLLASDAKVRQQVARLENAWEMLDSLDRASVDEAFTHTTLEMAVASASEEIRQQQAEIPRRRRLQWLAGSAGVLAAGAAGFVAVWLLAPRPNEQLLRDLPVLENLDQYRQIDNIEFLRTLQREGLFAQQEADDEP